MPDSCKTISECDKIVNLWTNRKTIDWREVSLETSLAALKSHIPPAPTRTAIMKLGLLQACLSDSRGVTLLPGLCSPAKAHLLPTASRRSVNHRVGSPAVLTDELAESCDWQPALYLAGHGRACFSLQGGQTETSHPHLPRHRVKRLLCYSDDITVLLYQLGWHQFESLPEHNVCNCKTYFQHGAFSIISDTKDKKQEAGAEVEFKVMDERNVLIVCLCQLWLSGILFLFSPSPLKHPRRLKCLILGLLACSYSWGRTPCPYSMCAMLYHNGSDEKQIVQRKTSVHTKKDKGSSSVDSAHSR